MEIPEVDVAQLAAQISAGAALVDVRELDEWTEARVPGVPLIPLGEVVERTDEFPTDQTVYVICRSGGRSGQAVGYLRSVGVDAVNVAGGTLAWIEAGYSVDAGPA